MPIVGTIASKVITNAAFFITLNRSPFISSHAGQWLADYEKVKRIALLADEFTIDGGELTPTLKVRRRVVEQKYSGLIESLYTGGD